MVPKIDYEPTQEQDAGEAIGLKLKEARIERGLTHKEIAKKIGITPRKIQSYEYGSEQIPANKLALLAAVLEMPVSCFFGDFKTGIMNNSRRLMDTGLTLDLVYSFECISDPEVKFLIWQLVKNIAEGTGEI